MSLTANEAYRDAVLRHQIQLRRYSGSVLKKIMAMLLQADRDLAIQLRARLAKFPSGGRIDVTSERWKLLLQDIRAARQAVFQQYKDAARGDLGALSVDEADRELGMLKAAIPIEVSFTRVAAPQLRAIATKRPFQGHLLKDWFTGLERVDRARITQALQLGMTQGQTTDQIVTRIVGTRAADFSDGILSMTRRDATAIARTAINAVSNAAREDVWQANSDIIQAMIWHSTLDGRTTPICRARDGMGTPIGGNDLPDGVLQLTPAGATPPAHMNCRSVMVAYIDGIGLVGKRPSVTDTRGRAERETDFRALARENGTTVQEERSAWADANIGRVPSATTYQEWLTSQKAGFQDDVLGPTRGQLFRDGGLRLDQFVDRAGAELTLDQLRGLYPSAFEAIGD